MFPLDSRVFVNGGRLWNSVREHIHEECESSLTSRRKHKFEDTGLVVYQHSQNIRNWVALEGVFRGEVLRRRIEVSEVLASGAGNRPESRLEIHRFLLFSGQRWLGECVERRVNSPERYENPHLHNGRGGPNNRLIRISRSECLVSDESQ